MTIGGNAEGRAYERRPLTGGRIRGRLVHFDMVQDIPADAVDVSPMGIGVLIDNPMPPGESVWLIVDGRIVRLTVRHCSKRQRGDDRYHCGLVSNNSWESIERLFARVGCLADGYDRE